ncbi:MAG: glycosyltransferase family 9 protein [Inquilinaceae bacterium]
MLSTGVLGHLTDERPEARVTVACGPLAESLFAAAPEVERVIVLRKRPYAGHWRDLWRACIGIRWDLIVDLRNTAVSRLLVARRRIVKGGGRAAAEHVVVELGRLLGLPQPPSPRLWLDEARRAAGARLIPPGPPVLALAPSANWAAKIWPADRFASLARRLTGSEGPLPGGRVAVLAAEGERAIAQPVIDALPEDRRIDLVGRTDPALAGACLERSTLYVGNDTGLSHIAAAAGVPTLVLFGPGYPDRYGPWGPLTAIARTAIPREALFETPGYHHTTTGTLMESLSVDMADEAAQALMARADAAGRDPVTGPG